MYGHLMWHLVQSSNALIWITFYNQGQNNRPSYSLTNKVVLLQPPFTISAPTIILWNTNFLSSLVSLLPIPLPQTLYRATSAPPLPFLFLPCAINCIQVYYYLVLSLLYTSIRFSLIHVFILFNSEPIFLYWSTICTIALRLSPVLIYLFNSQSRFLYLVYHMHYCTLPLLY